MKKQMLWKTKGMNQDLSVSAFNPEFSFENMNLRLSTNEGNTTLSWVNEKGTAQVEILSSLECWTKDGETVYTQPIEDGWTHQPEQNTSISGTPIGTAILNHYLIVLTHGSFDYIYKLERVDDTPKMLCSKLYEGNLGFDVKYPIETLVDYESEAVQKVYWTDGLNPPRIINVASSITTEYNDNSFDFVKKLKLEETVTVKKVFGFSGTFAPGVIQYAFTYYSKYGQETCIFYTSPLLYISHKDRGASPEDRVENAFKITIEKIDTSFDYLRIYSIQRTSINGTPICKRVQDISTKGLDDNDGDYYATYIDTGNSGDTIDPTELLYKGGEKIIVGTIASKDNTLFMGNLKIVRENIQTIKSDTIPNIVDAIRSKTALSNDTRLFEPLDSGNASYEYKNQLTSTTSGESRHHGMTVPCGGFKGGDYYRCGVQFQHETGKWSEPIWIDDFQVEGHSNYNNGEIKVPVIKGVFMNSLTQDDTTKPIELLWDSGYRKIRPVVVFPESGDRRVVCQGVSAPTVYTEKQANTDHTLYAQSSWFFRPYIPYEMTSLGSSVAVAPKSRNTLDYANSQVTPTIPYGDENDKRAVFNPQFMRRIEIEGCFHDDNKFKIRDDFRTLHSPDVEFDEQLWLSNFTGTTCQCVAMAEINRTLSYIDIQTESPTVNNKANGFSPSLEYFNGEENKAKGIVSGLFYEDGFVDDNVLDSGDMGLFPYPHTNARWLVYPWQCNGSLNNDTSRPSNQGTPTAVLKKKIISNLRYAITVWKDGYASFELQDSPQIFSEDNVGILRFKDSNLNPCNYMGNIDTMLTPDFYDGNYCAFNGWEVTFNQPSDIWSWTEDTTPFDSIKWAKTFSNDYQSNDSCVRLYGALEHRDSNNVQFDEWDGNALFDNQIGEIYIDLLAKKTPVRMKYKSTPHLVCPFVYQQSSVGYPNQFSEGDSQLAVFEILNPELAQQEREATLFGGRSSDAFRENVWLPCGEPVLFERSTSKIEFYYDYGDTYFQRYDCLKTYPFTTEDVNQIVEIGSFMLETHVNIDGRYDRNRGSINNLNVSPRNFNLLNPVYSQRDNFFSYKILDKSSYENYDFPNQITWSKTKTSGADVDLWTNITLSSVLELDGDKGGIAKILKFNDQLIAFQDRGISQILYNERMQMSTVQGVPVELGNSDKVDGKRYLTDTIGCSNKWSIVSTPLGIYFMDSYNKNIYLFNGQVNNLSDSLGFSTWAKNNIPAGSVRWNPLDFDNFVAYYDRNNQDVLFINSSTALAYSEKIGTFTSFYDYGGTPFFCNIDDVSIWIRADSSLWQHQAGSYCKFFGDETECQKPYWMTLVGNPEPQLDKIFTNLEFRASVEGDGESDEKTGKFIPTLPFDSLETWNEYQHGETALKNLTGHAAMQHPNTGDSALKRKFRIWRCDIPRDNIIISVPETASEEDKDKAAENKLRDTALGVSRIKQHPVDRMRNPWLYLKLLKSKGTDKKVEIHDMMMTYFN